MVRISSFAAFILTLATVPATAATLQVDQSGLLTGAKGVIVKGQSYDVTFVKASCVNEFNGCVVANFDFSSEEDATAAANALSDQVFVDGPLGDFDSDAFLTSGCYNEWCNFFIPFEIDHDVADAIGFLNYFEEPVDGIFQSNLVRDFDLANTSDGFFARFSQTQISSGVPEPAAWALMIMGFGAIGISFRARASKRLALEFA